MSILSRSPRTIVVVQCRLSSSRLPQKALLPLGGKPLISWTLSAMKKVRADKYFVATDEKSYDLLENIVKMCGFEIFAGPEDDVLERFCRVAEKTHADIIIRATADNPFLFYEAASSLLERFILRYKSDACDYMTFTGLPHGSGVEIFRADSLFRARKLTDFPYDREHVGPAFYNHPENFKSLMIKAEKSWNFPTFRTTVDTQFDYRRAQMIVHLLSKDEKPLSPYTAEQIVSAFTSGAVSKPILCVPSVKKGKGTGHLLRCLNIASQTGAYVYIPRDADLQEIPSLVKNAKEKGFSDFQILDFFPEKGDLSLIVTDSFMLSRESLENFSRLAPIVAIDEGSVNTEFCDYLLDIIPSYGLTRKANFSEPAFITLPKNVRSQPKIEKSSDIKKILVTLGGEDPADLVVPAVIALSDGKRKITGTVHNVEEAYARLPKQVAESGCILFVEPIHNLREHLAEYDLVVSHYGFTAFESVAAGCAVILLGTTALHVNLAKKYGFACIPSDKISFEQFEILFSEPKKLYRNENSQSKSLQIDENEKLKTLPFFINELSNGQRLFCPICGEKHDTLRDQIIARTEYKTFRRCSSCSIRYISWTRESSDVPYNNAYFFDDYKAQYGKTYLEDFSAIKAQGIRRVSILDLLYRNLHKTITPNVLDIGCAYGPFLDAANDAGWQVFGTDVCEEAILHVQNVLHFPAAVSHFPNFDSSEIFGLQSFDAVTMWFVIEHFKDLDSVLRAVSRLVKLGGLFAFSTPSAAGVSAKFSPNIFYEQSPSDHYSIWEPICAPQILRRYGFRVIKTISTGHHPERFPNSKKKYDKSIFLNVASRVLRLGDTFEVYCKKERDI